MGKKLLLENTLIGLFDIQGYSDFIKSTPRDEAIEKTKKLYSFAKSAATTDFGPIKTLFWILSDTIIIAIDTTRAPLSFGSAYLFLNACSDLLHSALPFCNLPLRGAIGSGYLYFDENTGKDDYGDSSFLLGDGLVDAASFEKQQNWLGAMITPNAVKAMDQFICNEDGKKLLDCVKVKDICAFGNIPMKENIEESGYYLLPFSRNNNWRDNLPSYFKDIDNKLANSDRVYSN